MDIDNAPYSVSLQSMWIYTVGSTIGGILAGLFGGFNGFAHKKIEIASKLNDGLIPSDGGQFVASDRNLSRAWYIIK